VVETVQENISGKKLTKSIHLASTIWFIVCVGYILVLALRQAGVRWWVLFSLSGHGALVVFLLISLYLFAIFRGVSSSQKVRLEHPLTSTIYYRVFYVLVPLLGGLAGCLGMIGMVSTVSQFLLGVAMGTLGTTFLVWVVVDPVTGLLEMMLPPASRRHRAERLAQAKAEREARNRGREHLLAEVLEKEEANVRCWQDALRGEAERLAQLLAADKIDFKQAEREAMDIGASAWRMGGIGCMRTLREMAVAICEKEKKQKRQIVDYIPVWWDGIGTWRNRSFHEATRS
jgi:hypothetical protein